MLSVITLLAIYGLAHGIKDSELLARPRNWIMRNKWVGVFFYQLLSCYFCLGFWCGLIIYSILNLYSWNFQEFIVYGFAGASVCYLLNGVINKLYS